MIQNTTRPHDSCHVWVFVGDYGGWPVVDSRSDVTGPVL